MTEEIQQQLTDDDSSFLTPALCSRLVEPDAASERSQIDPALLEKANYAFTDNLIKTINDHVGILYVEAQTAADSFMAAVHAMRESTDEEKEKTYIRPRIRLTEYKTIDIAWIKISPGRYPISGPVSKGQKVFYKKINGKKVAFPAKARRIKKGNGTRYVRSLFKGESETVLQLIELCENKFEFIRKQSEKLSKLRSAAYEFNRCTTKLYDEIIGESESRPIPVSPSAYRTDGSEDSDAAGEFFDSTEFQ